MKITLDRKGNEDRYRNWFLTINNYTTEEKEYALAYSALYILVADEVGEEKKTPHLHLYFELKNAKSFSKIKKEFPRANIDLGKGTAEQNKIYLSKQNLIREDGTPKKQGKRNDIHEVISQIENGDMRMRDVVRTATSVQSVRMAEIRLKYFEPKRDFKPEVIWIYGSTGTGKSRLAKELCDDPYYCLDDIKWWEGYDAHTEVIIDDFRKDYCRFNQLLKLLDRYAYRVECKGGSRQFLAKKIIITTPLSPEETYSNLNSEDIEQLSRRITEIKCLDIL